MSVPNQKIIVCDTWEGHIPDGVTFSKIIHNINEAAMTRLSGSGYKLYMYLYCNKKGFELELSPVTVKKKTGMGKSAYDGAVKELIDNGFLSLIHGNKYRFTKEPATRATVMKSVDGNSVDGKSYHEKAPSPDNHMTGSMIFGGPSPDNHMTGGMVSGGEIHTDNTTIHTNNIGVSPFEGENNIARGVKNNASNEPMAEIAFALIAQSGKRYSPELFKKELQHSKEVISNMKTITGDPDYPVWKYLQFENEAAYRAAVEQVKSQLQIHAYDDDELPF